MLIGPGSSNLAQAILQGKQLGLQRKGIQEQAKSRRQQLGLGIAGLGLKAVDTLGGLYGTVGSLNEAAARREQSGKQFQQRFGQDQYEFGKGLEEAGLERELRKKLSTQHISAIERQGQAHRDAQARLEALRTTAAANTDVLRGQQHRDLIALSDLLSRKTQRESEGQQLDAQHAARMQDPIAWGNTLKRSVELAQKQGEQGLSNIASELALREPYEERVVSRGLQSDLTLQDAANKAAAERQAAENKAAQERLMEQLNRNAPYVYDAKGTQYPWALAQAEMARLAKEREYKMDREAQELGFGHDMEMTNIADILAQRRMSQEYAQRSKLQAQGEAAEINKIRTTADLKPPPWAESPNYTEDMYQRSQDIHRQAASGLISDDEALRQLDELSKTGAWKSSAAERTTSNISGLEAAIGNLSPESLKNQNKQINVLKSILKKLPESQQGDAIREIDRRIKMSGGTNLIDDTQWVEDIGWTPGDHQASARKFIERIRALRGK